MEVKIVSAGNKLSRDEDFDDSDEASLNILFNF